MKKIALASCCVAISTVGASAAEVSIPNAVTSPNVIYTDNDRMGASEYSSSIKTGFSGFVEGRYSNTQLSEFNIQSNEWGIRGSVNYNSASLVGVQVDASYSTVDVEGLGFDNLAAMGHVYYRPLDEVAAGAFLGGSQLSTDVFDNLGLSWIDSDVEDIIGGLEAATMVDQGTVYGRVGFGRTTYSGFGVDHYLGTIGARIYLNDNIRFDAEGSINRFAINDLGHVNLYTAIASANYRFNQVPATIFGGYRYDSLSASNGVDTVDVGNTNTFFAGLRYSFGSESLKDEERNGPIWSSNSTLPF
ncbi:hypothetical protein WNY59_15895 [Ahrensia kielensis]|uniref:Outer membrane protein beta-barrel domain-containing protein n=2 Tax=Ahrensia kielensis TaxID=76980 RepID=A0ABU9TAC9_9HYPH